MGEDTKGRFTRMFERQFISDQAERVRREREDNQALAAQAAAHKEDARRSAIQKIVLRFRDREAMLAARFPAMEEDRDAGFDRVRYRFPRKGDAPHDGVLEFWCEYGRVGDAFHIHSFVEVDDQGAHDRISFPAATPDLGKVETFVESKLLEFVQRYID